MSLKTIVLVPFIAAAFAITAKAQAPAAGDDFANHKKEALERIDKGIAGMNEAKACVSAAADNEALRKCHEIMRAHHQEMKSDRIGDRMKRMEERKKRIDAKKP